MEKQYRSDSCFYSEWVRRTRRRGLGHEAEGGRAVLLILVVVLVMSFGGWVAAYAGATGKVPRGTDVAGVDIGGRDRSAASSALAKGLSDQLQTPIAVTVGTQTVQVAPADAGLSVDYEASVAKALGPRSWDPRQLWRYYTGGDEITPVVNVDEGRMDAILDLLDQRAGQPARDAGIALTGGQIDITKPRDGVQLDHDRAEAAIVDAWTAGRPAVNLPLLLTPPDVDDADLQAAIREIANPVLSGPVTLAFAGSQVALSPRQFADVLRVVPRDGALALDVDAAGLAALVQPAAQDTTPVDATVALQAGAPAVVPAVAGQSYDRAGVTAAFLQGVTADGATRTVPVTGTATKAAFTTREAKRLGVIEPVASYTVPVPSTVGPAFTDAAARVSGALLRPGDTFSFNSRVGAPTGSAARLATATWNAGFLAGLTDVARTPSPTWTDGLPEGRDAWVDGGTDLQLRNDSSYGVLLSARVTPGSPGAPGSVVVDVWSTKEWDVTATTGARYALTPPATFVDPNPGCVAQPGADGFAVDLVRTFSRVGDSTPVRTDTVTTAYPPVQAVVCQAPPPPV
jgi:vancomycin resistance protein YoaR